MSKWREKRVRLQASKMVPQNITMKRAKRTSKKGPTSKKGAKARKGATPMISSKGRYQNMCGAKRVPRPGHGGYCSVQIDGKLYRFCRLVLTTCGPSPEERDPEKTTTNHKNSNTVEDKPNNLEWASLSDQAVHSLGPLGKRKTGLGSCRGTSSRPVKVTARTRGKSGVYASAAAAAKALDTSPYRVRDYCKTGGNLQIGKETFQVDYVPEPDLPVETWREVHGYMPEILRGYFVSSLGRYQNKQNRHKHYPDRGNNGYCWAYIGRRKHALHRLICRVFNGKPPSKKHTQVNHKDKNKSGLGNRASNVEWCTPRQNQLHAHRTGKESAPLGPRVPVLVQKKGEEQPTRYHSKKAAAIALKVSYYTIDNIISGKYKSTDFEVKLDNDDLPGELWKPVVLTGARVM